MFDSSVTLSVYVATMNWTVDSVLFAFLFPSLWEIKVAVAASVFVIIAYRFFAARTGHFQADPSLPDNSAAVDVSDDKDKVIFVLF